MQRALSSVWRVEMVPYRSAGAPPAFPFIFILAFSSFPPACHLASQSVTQSVRSPGRPEAEEKRQTGGESQTLPSQMSNVCQLPPAPVSLPFLAPSGAASGEL